MPELARVPWGRTVVVLAVAAAGTLWLSHTALKGRHRPPSAAFDTLATAEVQVAEALLKNAAGGSERKQQQLRSAADGGQQQQHQRPLRERGAAAVRHSAGASQGRGGRSGSGAGVEDTGSESGSGVFVTETVFVTTTAYEDVTVTLAARYTTRGCRCASDWTYKGVRCDTGCCAFDDARGEWCAIEDPVECRIQRGTPQNWGYCSEPGTDPDALLGDSALDHQLHTASGSTETDRKEGAR